MFRKFVIAIAKKASLIITKVLSIVVKTSSRIIEASFIIVRAFTNVNVLSSSSTLFIHVTIKATLSLAIASILIDTKFIVDKFLLSLYIDIDFYLMSNLIYHVKNDKIRLCIFQNTKSIMIKTIYDDYFHANHYRVYVRLNDIIYIHKLSRKLIIYIRYCS